MNSLCTKYSSLISVLIYGFLFLHLSSCQTLSEESLDYVNRNEILENIEILERSNDVESASTDTITSDSDQSTPEPVVTTPVGTVCCRAMIAQCLSCTAGQTLSEYCVIYPATVGCPTRDEMSMNADNAQSNDAVIIQSATTSNVNPNGNGEHAFHTEPPIIDDDADELRRNLHTGPELYMQGGLPRPRFVMLGQQGVGKSSLANALLGFDNLAAAIHKKKRKELPFQIGHGLRSKTKATAFSTGRFLGTGPNVTVVDTPGFKDTEDAEFVDELMNVLGDEVKEVDSFLIVYKYKDRFTRPFKRTLTMLTKMFGNFWTNVVIVVNFWSFKKIHDEERRSVGVTPEKYSRQLSSLFENKFDLKRGSLPLVFIDTHYNRSNPEEKSAFQIETEQLWTRTMDRRPFKCLTRKDVQENLRKEKQDFATMKRNCRATKQKNQKLEMELRQQTKKIEAQRFVMTNLRNGIDYLKQQCDQNDGSKGEVFGCEWSSWGEWSECTKSCGGGNVMRMREKLPGIGSCDGAKEEITVCDNEVCPLENDVNSLIMIIGGETIASRENEHSNSVEIIGPNGLCRFSGVPDLPEPRGKVSVAYDPSGAVIVCGGGETFWRPNANCWQLVAGATSAWEEIHQIFPVHGAATTFFQGKMWVFGGATGDDTKDHTITDKVQAYNTRLKEWTVEVPLSQPRHKSCAVTIDSYVVLTGGTSLGLGKYKPQWLAEIGTRKTEMFDGQTWTPLPSMNRAKVEHGCAVATIAGTRGIVVVGGATGDDVVEFLDWDTRDKWVQLGKLNRGRGMMPGVGFVGGNLSIIGGYSWPGGVKLIEKWNDLNDEWDRSNFTLKYPRYNHGTITVPGEMFPQCVNPVL